MKKYQVLPTKDGLLFCGHCGILILCDECGDMPETCKNPSCAVRLDWSLVDEFNVDEENISQENQ